MKKTILITGGSRGIGAATALLAAERGYAVCLSFHSNSAAADAVVASIVQAGGTASALQADVALEADVLRLFEHIDTTYGRLDALVNNAGILDQQMRLDEMSLARISRIFATNVFGSFLCAREAVRRMSTRHGGAGGAIVNISSRAAKLGAAGEYIDYAASKAAVDTLTIGLAKEVGNEGIRVNTVAPGMIHTDIHACGGEPQRVERVKAGIPMQRGGYPEEVARAVLWLLSDEASFTTGSCIDVAGGR